MSTEKEPMEGGHPGEDHPITIYVNRRPVVMHERRATGVEIKAAAIAQGVHILPDYSLFVIRKDESLEQVGDNERITLHEGEQFSATAPDDNS